jgi:hypothetical protein
MVHKRLAALAALALLAAPWASARAQFPARYGPLYGPYATMPYQPFRELKADICGPNPIDPRTTLVYIFPLGASVQPAPILFEPPFVAVPMPPLMPENPFPPAAAEPTRYEGPAPTPAPAPRTLP